MANAGGKPVRNPEREKPKWEDTITNRMRHWSYTPEQKEEVKKALAAGVPKATILTYFYPEVTVEEMSIKVKEGIADTNRTIAKIDSFGKGMREAGQKVANTFRTFADKEEVDYSGKEKKFSKTEVAKKPWKWQKKVYESMVLYLDATIDKVEDLSRDVELDRMEKKQIDKPEQVTDIRDAIALVSSVAEPTEYQFGAEAFEAAYPKMDSGIKPEEKAPSVPKTGKTR